MIHHCKQRRHSCCRPRYEQGFTLIEALVASLILASSVMALVSMWYFSFGVTVKSDDVGVAYTVGRHAMERVKLAGFDYAAEGNTVLYYDRLGGSESASQQAQHRMRVVTNVTSVSDTAPWPSYGSWRTVTITVTLLNTGQTLYKTGARLVKQGI